MQRRMKCYLSICTAILISLLSISCVRADDKQFKPLAATGDEIKDYYTPIILDGYAQPVFAFTDTKGEYRYRVYGTKNGEEGYYQASVERVAPTKTTEGYFNVNIVGEHPENNDRELLSVGHSRTLPNGLAPNGFGYGRRKDVIISYTNIFGEQEYLVHGTIDQENEYYFPSKNRRPVKGSLPVDLDSLSAYMCNNGGFVKRPAFIDGQPQHRVYIVPDAGAIRPIVSVPTWARGGTVLNGRFVENTIRPRMQLKLENGKESIQAKEQKEPIKLKEQEKPKKQRAATKAKASASAADNNSVQQQTKKDKEVLVLKTFVIGRNLYVVLAPNGEPQIGLNVDIRILHHQQEVLKECFNLDQRGRVISIPNVRNGDWMIAAHETNTNTVVEIPIALH